MADLVSTLNCYDETPEIFYDDGIARLVIKYHLVCSGEIARESVEYWITPTGRYSIWQQNLTNVYPHHQRKLRKDYLEAWARNNSGTLPVIDVLGKTERANRKLLQELKLEARHLSIDEYVRP